jgi:anti-anti-sigma factor
VDEEAAVDEDAELHVVTGGYPVRLELEVVDDPEAGLLVLKVRGVLDSGTAATLRAASRFLIYHPAVVIELSGVEHIDQAGLGALVGLVRSVHETGGMLALAAAPSGIDAVLRTAGLARAIPCTMTVAESREALAPALTSTLH